MRRFARRVLPFLLVLGTAMAYGFGAGAVSAAGAPAPKTPLQVTYYFLPG